MWETEEDAEEEVQLRGDGTLGKKTTESGPFAERRLEPEPSAVTTAATLPGQGGSPAASCYHLSVRAPATPRTPSNPQVQDRNSEDSASEEPRKEPPRRHDSSRPGRGAPRGLQTSELRHPGVCLPDTAEGTPGGPHSSVLTAGQTRRERFRSA